MKSLRIGTRGSALALAQANWVKRQVEVQRRDWHAELKIVRTTGDRFADASLQIIGGKGVFTKEIEEALLRDEIDIAVHSMKDLPTELAAGLIVGAVPEREDPRDVLVTRDGTLLDGLAAAARIGTGSLRRQAQLLHYRPDLSVIAIRGNVDTRLKKLDAGEVDALVMAAAGLKRIGHGERIVQFLPDDICMQAVAQGALALQMRSNRPLVGELAFLHDERTCIEVSAERALLNRLGGGCLVPVGARATVKEKIVKLSAVVAEPNGRSICRGDIEGASACAARLGEALADRLLNQGAGEILRSVRSRSQ